MNIAIWFVVILMPFAVYFAIRWAKPKDTESFDQFFEDFDNWNISKPKSNEKQWKRFEEEGDILDVDNFDQEWYH